jgi:hypothetical protein
MMHIYKFSLFFSGILSLVFWYFKCSNCDWGQKFCEFETDSERGDNKLWLVCINIDQYAFDLFDASNPSL